MNLWRFDSLLEAHVIIEDWRIDYNTRRPHTAHDDTTPAEFTAASTITSPTNPKSHNTWTTQRVPLNGPQMDRRRDAPSRTAIPKIIGHTDLVTRIDGEQHERNQTQETATPTSA